MDMATDDPIHAGIGGQSDHSLLELRHILDRGLRLKLEPRRDRPVAEPHSSPDTVEIQVEVQDLGVEAGSDPLEESVEMDESVELMAVKDEKPPSVGGDMDHAFGHPDSTQRQAGVTLQELVVIAVEVGHPGFLAVPPENLLNDCVGVLGPMPFPP
jgi:hypothetical protein